MRVKIIKEFVMESFPAKPLLNYALEVEKITTSKKPNLILNVDGVIAVSFVDLLRHSGSFTRYISFLKNEQLFLWVKHPHCLQTIK
jgi:ATP citrate (pro-S)-lyase